MKINFYATFRPIVGGKTISIALPDQITVAELLQTLILEFPALGPKLLDEQGSLFQHVHVFVNGRDTPYLPDALETPLTQNDTIDIFPPVGGGSGLILYGRGSGETQ